MRVSDTPAAPSANMAGAGTGPLSVDKADDDDDLLCN
jgi:hypothetical protein